MVGFRVASTAHAKTGKIPLPYTNVDRWAIPWATKIKPGAAAARLKLEVGSTFTKIDGTDAGDEDFC